MATQGVVKGAVGATHELTEKKQGTYHYTMGPYSKSVLEIASGDRVIVETRDAFEGRITSEADVLEMPYINPQNGPILVTGEEKGDALAVMLEVVSPEVRTFSP